MRSTLLLVVATACAAEPLQPPTGEVVAYRVTGETFPTTNAEARDSALDLNGDDKVDNELGMVLGSLFYRDLPPTEGLDALIASDELQLFVDVQYPRSDENTIAFAMYPAGAQSHGLLFARANANPLILGTANVTTAIGFYGQRVELELLGARARLTAHDEATVAGTIVGGVRRSEIDAKLVPPLAMKLEEMIARDCPMRDAPPNCGCIRLPDGEYGGLYWLQLFDVEPRDCKVSDPEISENSLIKSLLAPDVMIGGEQLVSFGFNFSGEPL
jgi:hypothetical protein